MKKIFKPMILMFMLMAAFMSCNNEELFIEDVVEEVVDDTTGEDTEEEETDDTSNEDTSIDATLPCDFDLSDVTAGDTVVINCVMDLDGATVNLPSNVTILYEGGDIVNGTLNFSDNTTIDGNLLNSTITLTGSSPALKDPVFDFIPERWGIVEGVVSSEVALNNRDILETLMEEVKKYGVTTFSIDEMDAYFEVSLVTSGTTNQNFYPSVEAINVPSDFNLVMSENTFLRVQPNSRKLYGLLAIRDASNVTIKGGNLYGDRDEHDYSDGGTHEWGHLLFLHGAVNSTVDGVTMKNATGDGMKLEDINFTFQSNWIPTHDITIVNCIFDSNRRNNMSITAGYNIYVTNNEFYNASVDTDKSEGVAPGYALDVEALRGIDEATGEYIYYERAEDIFITNNIEKNSRKGGFTVAIGFDVTIENNNVESGISFSLANGVKIIGNTVTATTTDKQDTGTGIKAGRSSSTGSTIYNNLVQGNTVTGFSTGISVNNEEINVKDNIINNCKTGITFKNLTDGNIQNNTIKSTRDDSMGVYSYDSYANGVYITGNDIEVDRNPFKLSKINYTSEYYNYVLEISDNIVKNNDTNSTLFSECYGIDFTNNTLDHGIEVFNSEQLSFETNTISTVNDHGFDIREVNKNILISSNNIDVSEKKLCVNIDSNSSGEVTENNNSCQ
ncbi:right-handed parallel beta-helix repeat-containing protein [Seonamhaeicola sp. NFXS20]|uniref:right-handed parallel beta-helix repeat-containing protein n=1 Tax=Seonamhaeicola sp. NFXS20 TaxID=2816959 RepID=UPI003B8BC0DA